MSLFKKLFNLSQKPLQPQHSAEEDEQSKYMPERKDLPVDERFIHHFTTQGGRFLYCLNQDEVNQSLEQILHEHNWIGSEVFCPDKALKERLADFDLDLDSNCSRSEILISTCEYVIADSGALLFSSNQVN